MLIYKILRAAEWQALNEAGETAGAPVDVADGYVHFSTAAQLPGTLARHFAAEGDLWLLSFEAARLGPALRWEPARGGDLFPHLYAPLRLADACAVQPLPRGPAGHALPEGL
ncbi:MAG: hypothetical protein RLZ26_1148 [Pseudomonadota bacterium]|jgi:uncharacterized protein (DUF952 family)